MKAHTAPSLATEAALPLEHASSFDHRSHSQDTGPGKQLHVLLCAYQCGPGQGSVSQIGWEWYQRLARKARVTLVTHSRNRAALTNSGVPLAGSDVVYIDTEWFAGRLHRLAQWLFPSSEHAANLISSLDFYVYDAKMLRVLGRVAAPGWQVVHAVTPVSPVAATRLHKLGLPLVVGPWNGGLRTPATFPELMKQDASWIYGTRMLGRALDRVFGTTRHATCILTATQSTDRSLHGSSRGKVRRMLENGVDLDLFRAREQPTGSFAHAALRVLFVGRLIPAKAIPLLLEAVRRVQAELPIEVTIVGSGSLRPELEEQARAMGVADKVLFTGARSLEEIAAIMQGVDLFCLPSIRESGGAVLLEAMASALPVVGVRWGGPGELIDAEVGALLSADGPEPLIRDLVAVFREAYHHPQAWQAKGQAGRRRAVQLYDWNAKIDHALALYAELLMTRAAHD